MPSSFRFVHAADLHLGSPFKGLSARDPELAHRFAEATRKAFTALVSRTLELKADFMVIAGDVYDGEWQDNAVGLFFNREIARLDRAGIPVFVLRGNHDAASVVTRSISMPENVRGFDTRKPQTHRLEPLRVALHGQSFADRSQGDNLARSYPAPEPGWFNIGVLHTSLTGRPPHADYAPCSVDDLRARGYDYWALGHVHDHEVIDTDPHIVFPGNLQGRSIRETGAKGAVLVTVTDGRVTGCERMIVDEARWALLELDISGLADLDAILSALEEALRPHVQAAEGRALALRLRLSGESSLRAWLLANRALLRDEAQAAAARVDADVSLEKLVLDVTGGEAREAEAENGDPLIDLGGMLAGLRQDPEVLAAVEEVIGQVTGKMPHGLGADLDTGPEALAALIEEAGEVLLQKVGGKD
ncbi:DNA repair exonuclease [Stappia taiwanensis]|uniref:DNA repair exonuclease n=1 Tax=Stappia taiwanensis TaxID=992267 RepID=A0A838XLI4_9HYPH|nr:DNA repair exonuclease [Stappia taiwanensis]MBA4612179.1 DNA repair exonuclease [Stappia taiwanensis]GGE92978.1 metallophosphoesterase [Stappia taiwanensis]